MMEWEYTFDPVSREDWIKQIETDLRHKPLSSLQGEWWPGEPLLPLLHSNDIEGEPIRLPDHFFNHPPQITECINAIGLSAIGINQKIIEALQYGTQSIILRTSLPESHDYEVWFNGVMQEIVALSIEPDSTHKDSTNQASNISQNNLLVRLQRQEDSLEINEFVDDFLANHSSPDYLRFVYFFPSAGNWIDQTSQILNKVMKDLEGWTSSGLRSEAFFDQCILSVQADPSYFKHIIQTRVLHLLWQNIRDHEGLDAKVSNENYLECHITQNENENPELFLIRASMSALAASLSGTHALCIHHTNQEGIQSFYGRINRNIHHLLNLESGMYKGIDPLSGSFQIDFHARTWTKKIWDMLSL